MYIDYDNVIAILNEDLRIKYNEFAEHTHFPPYEEMKSYRSYFTIVDNPSSAVHKLILFNNVVMHDSRNIAADTDEELAKYISELFNLYLESFQFLKMDF